MDAGGGAVGMGDGDAGRRAGGGGAARDAGHGPGLSTYNDVFSRVAGFLSSLFRLAGHDDLADNIRPSRRHPGRT